MIVILQSNVTDEQVEHVVERVEKLGLQAHLSRGTDDIKVVILDAALAGMRGAATLDEVKKQRPELPTVITSGHNVDEVALRFQNFDKLTFLQKPWTVDTLVGALREVLTQ